MALPKISRMDRSLGHFFKSKNVNGINIDFSGAPTSSVDNSVRREHELLHDRGTAVRVVREGGRRQENHHGAR